MLKGLKEAVAVLEKGRREEDLIIDQGRRAYRMGIEKRANPLNVPSARTLWERGWDLEQIKFEGMLRRWKA